MKLLFNNFFRSKIIFFIILVLIIILAGFFQLDRIRLKDENILLKDELESYINDINNRTKLEGKYFYDFSTISNDYFKRNFNYKYFTLIYLDTIECFSCFQFQINHLKELSQSGIIPVIYSHSSSHLLLLKKSLIKYLDISSFVKAPNITAGNRIIIAVLNHNGKIIYADVADKTNYEKSKKFYTKIKKFLFEKEQFD